MDDAPFLPDWVSAPGETLRDIVDMRNQTCLDVMEGLSLSLGQLDNLYIGSMKIDEKLAERLSVFAGASKEFWIAREKNYRDGRIRLGI